jgi:exodeoxyribonuclease VIII
MINPNPIEVSYTMDADQYHRRSALSKSLISHLLKSPAHLHAYLSAPKPEPSKEQVLGTAIHTATLEPEKYKAQFVVAPVVDRRTTQGKAIYADFQQANAGKTLISADDASATLAISQALRSNPLFGQALRNGSPEVSLFAKSDNGLNIKARFDLFDPETNTIWDIKSTLTADPFGFRREIFKYSYALQASHYLDVARKAGIGNDQTKFVFIAVEKETPWAIGCYSLDSHTLNKWDMIRANAFAQWKEATETGVYPAYSANEILILEA